MDERERSEADARPRRSTRARAAGIALCALGGAAGMATCGMAAPHEGGGDAAKLGIASFGLELFLGCVAVGFGLVSRRPLGERLGLGPGRLPAVSLALLVLGTLGLSQALDGVAEVAGLREHSALMELDAILLGASGTGFWLAILGVGLAPGFGEELLCRGLVQRGLEPRLGPAVAVVVAALFFGALHMEPIHGAFAAVLGLYLGSVAVLSGSIRTAILCHACNNLVAVGLAARAPDLLRPGPLSIALGLAVALACLGAVWRARGSLPGPGSAFRGLQREAQKDEQ